LRKF
jgi:hypothetical protein